MKWYDIILDIIKIILAGGFGAWIVHRLDLKKSKENEKLKEIHRRRDTLISILGQDINFLTMFINIIHFFKDPSSKQYIQIKDKLIKATENIDAQKPLFLDDKKIHSALNRINHIASKYSDGKKQLSEFDIDKYLENISIVQNKIIEYNHILLD